MPRCRRTSLRDRLQVRVEHILPARDGGNLRLPVCIDQSQRSGRLGSQGGPLQLAVPPGDIHFKTAARPESRDAARRECRRQRRQQPHDRRLALLRIGQTRWIRLRVIALKQHLRDARGRSEIAVDLKRRMGVEQIRIYARVGLRRGGGFRRGLRGTAEILDLVPVGGGLQQVLQNLVVNGIDAIRGSAGTAKELWIETAREDAGGITVKVKDSGVGLSTEVSDRIFQPFFTTKPQGIGLGLSISRSIIESHGGHLGASQNPCGGAIFQFTLPAASSEKHD